VTLAPPTLTLDVNQIGQLTPTITPANATNRNVTWSSSNGAVATVNPVGLVIAVAPGTATITVTTEDGGFTASSNVTVSDIRVTGVIVTPSSATLFERDTLSLTANVLPANAGNRSVTWSSGNPAVATVSATGVVTAVRGGAGSAMIIATTVDGGFVGMSAITVTGPRPPSQANAGQVFGATPPAGFIYAQNPGGRQIIATERPILAERNQWMLLLAAPAGYTVIGVDPAAGPGYELRVNNGNLEVRFTDAVADETVQVTLEHADGDRYEIEFEFSGEFADDSSSGCNAGFAVMPLLAIAALFVRRKK
jgi:Synergist-CTERM protein sorting domain-containing protein